MKQPRAWRGAPNTKPRPGGNPGRRQVLARGGVGGSSMRRGILIRATVVMVAALLLATPAALTSPAQATPRVARDPAVIRTWDAIAVRTIVVQGLKPPPVA